jgi:hypothetical protein
MKKIVVAVFMVLFATGFAWGAPFLQCDPQEGVVGYTLTGLTDLTVAAQVDGSLKYDLGNLANGTYTVSVAACNVWGCGDSVPFVIAKQLPARPAGVRLVAK